MSGEIFLTFDDGPDVNYTPQILEYLDDAKMHATFFVIGRNVAKNRTLIREIYEQGHDLGNHSYTHRHPWLLDRKSARLEVVDGAKAISDVIGQSVSFFRPPYGVKSTSMIESAEELNQELMMWDRSAIDWGVRGYAPGISKRLQAVGASEIVLMHDGAGRYNHPSELLKTIPGFFINLVRQRLKSRKLSDRANN
jgi:peptidoglycan/xylan/chitin deacetylase (PgdA/CDA1 family)